MFERIASYLYGDDVFISYSYDDTRYAEALAIELQARQFSVFLGGWGASPSRDLSGNVLRAARRCRLLVIVATPAAIASPFVQREVEIVSAHQRTVVPIDVGGAMGDRERWPGTDPVAEESSIVRSDEPKPSPHVVSRVENAATFVRQRIRLRRLVMASTIASVALIAGSSWWVRTAIRRAAAADDERRRQTEIASATRQGNDSMTLLQQRPDQLTQAALLAAVSLRRFQRLGLRALAPDTAIRESLALLPLVTHGTRFDIASETRQITEDARYVVAATSDRSFDVWDCDRGERTSFATETGSVIRALAISADGAIVAAALEGAGRDHLRTWRVSDGAPLGATRVSFPVEVIAASADGKFLAIGGYTSASAMILVRPSRGLVGGTELRRPSDQVIDGLAFSHSGRILAINGRPIVIWPWQIGGASFSPGAFRSCALIHPVDEDLVATMSETEPLRIWRWRQWNSKPVPIWSDPSAGADCQTAAFSGDGSLIAFIARAGDARAALWRDGAAAHSLRARRGGRRIAVDQTGHHVLLAYGDGTVELNNFTRALGRVAHRDDTLLGVAVRADGALASISTRDALLWRAAPPAAELLAPITGLTCAAAIDGRTIISPSGEPYGAGEIAVWSNPVTKVPVSTASVTAIAAAGDGHLFAGAEDGILIRFPSSLRPRLQDAAVLARAGTAINAIAVSRSSRFVAWAAGRTLFVAPIAGQSVAELRGAATIRAIVFIDDRRIAAGDDDGRVSIWSWRDRRRSAVLRHIGSVTGLAADEYGRLLAAAGPDGPALIWRVDSPAPLAASSLQTEPGVRSVAFSESGRFLITGGDDRFARVWSVADGMPAEVARFPVRGRVTFVSFLDHDRYVVVGDDVGGAQRFIWNDTDLLAVTCGRLQHLVDDRQRSTFVGVCADQAASAHPVRE